MFWRDAKFLCRKGDKLFPRERIGCGGDMPGLIPGGCPFAELYQALRGVSRVGEGVRNSIIHKPGYQHGLLHKAITQSAPMPTAAERAGDFSQFSGAVRDPRTGLPFTGNVIPSDRDGHNAGQFPTEADQGRRQTTHARRHDLIPANGYGFGESLRVRGREPAVFSQCGGRLGVPGHVADDGPRSVSTHASCDERHPVLRESHERLERCGHRLAPPAR
jgi:hypothetical protein